MTASLKAVQATVSADGVVTTAELPRTSPKTTVASNCQSNDSIEAVESAFAGSLGAHFARSSPIHLAKHPVEFLKQTEINRKSVCCFGFSSQLFTEFGLSPLKNQTIQLRTWVMKRTRDCGRGRCRSFVNEAFEDARQRFGSKRKDGARQMRGVGALAAGISWSFRDLQKGGTEKSGPSRTAVLAPCSLKSLG
jgi:hypothetical protein